jgi:hypothetical protein
MLRANPKNLTFILTHLCALPENRTRSSAFAEPCDFHFTKRAYGSKGSHLYQSHFT